MLEPRGNAVNMKIARLGRFKEENFWSQKNKYRKKLFEVKV